MSFLGEKTLTFVQADCFNKRFFICIKNHPFFVFSFWPFPLVRGGHSVSSFSKPFCLQHPSPFHQLSPYLFLLYLKIFSLVSLFSSFPVTPFPSSFFPHTLGLSSWHVHTTSACPPLSSFLTVLP